MIVDESVPWLYAAIIEGNLIWADNVDTTFDATFLIIRDGKLVIGTESAPYLH